MKVILTSDLHGSLPEIPECDLLLIGGDICPVKGSHKPHVQATWLRDVFAPWLEEVPAKHIVGIAGNHDFVFEDKDEKRKVEDLPWTYLQDEDVTIEGVRIWGTPWVPNLRSWAFHGGMDCECLDHFNDIPTDVDVVLSHGPMNGYGDVVPGAGHVGDRHMPEIIREVQPRLFVCGHIHEGYGHYRHPDVKLGIYNVAHMDGAYDPINPVVEIEL